MTPERWQQIKDVLHRAMELAPPDRAAFLGQACAGDPSLREEVESLLASDEKGRSSFLQSPPVLRLMKGTRLGDYEIQSLLGAGGMGEVYRARDPRLRRDVAIKVLPSFVSSDPERLRRFEQEATAAAALNHPNILAVYQMGTYEGAPYLVSELLEGETLREHVRRSRIAVRKAVDYAVQIARGLAAAHDKGIVHRDLKPENLFVTKDGRVKILDFGLAKLTQLPPGSEHSATTMGSETEPGVVMGTVGYMSPEQVRGQNADYHADIFAFGAVLYEMLSGKRAFQASTSAETMTAILNQDPPGISHLVPNLPPGLQRVVHRCLEKSPEQRFQSASDLAFGLEALSDSGSGFVAARPLPNKDSRRWMLILAAFAVAALAALAYKFRSPLTGTMSPAPTGPATITKISHWNKPMDRAVLSPNARTVAFSSPVDGFDQVFVMLTSGAEPLQLTKDSTDKVVDNFSADGNEIYFIQTLGSDEIWAVPTLGGNTRRIAEGTNLVSSIDGKYFFYEKPSEDAVMRAPQSGGAEELIYSFRGDLLDSLLLYPDGKSLLVGLRKEAGQTFRKLDIAKRTLEDLGHVSDVVSTPSWGLSGNTLYLSRNVNGLTNLWEYSLSSRSLNQVTSGPGPDYHPMGDPAGKGIFFVNGKNSGILRVYHVASRQSNDLVTEAVSQPEISPDGRHVAYVATPDKNDEEVWVSELDGSHRVKLPSDGPIGATLDWSPDGTRLPYETFLNGVGRPEARLTLIGPDGSHPVQSAWSGTFIGFIAWERDGKSFYFSDSDNPQGGGFDGKIWRADANGADITRLGENCGLITDVSPDHRYLIGVVLFGGKTGIYQFSISDGKCTLLKEGVATFTARFAADGKSFVYSNTSHGETYIYRQPWRTGKMGGSEKPVLKFPLAFRAGSAYLGNSYDVSRDLSTIVYARPGGHADLYFLRRSP